jgi:hypothetical protein
MLMVHDATNVDPDFDRIQPPTLRTGCRVGGVSALFVNSSRIPSGTRALACPAIASSLEAGTVTDARDEQHVRQIADALREELDDNQDSAALARLAGAAFGDEMAPAGPASPEKEAGSAEIPPSR